MHGGRCRQSWATLDFRPVPRYLPHVLASKRTLASSLPFALACLLALCPPRTQAQNRWYRGTIIRTPPASYVIQMDDGALLDVEWNSGYDNWSPGDRVILTTESGGGFMFYRNKRTQVDVFAYDPAEIGE